MENSGQGMPEDYSMLIIEKLALWEKKKKKSQVNSEEAKNFYVVLCCQLTYILILFKHHSLNIYL